MGMEMDS